MKVFDGAVELFEHIWLRSNHLHTNNIFQSQAGLSGGGGAKVNDIGRKRIGFAKGGRRRKEKKEETISKENYIGKISKDWFWCTAGDLAEEKGLVGRLVAWGKEIVRENPA